MHRIRNHCALAAVILVSVGSVVATLLTMVEEASAAAPQIILKQTPLGPMPADSRELSISADAAHVALLASAGTRHVVYIDGNEGVPYSSVQQASGPGQGDVHTRAAPAMLMISPDKTRFAYLASKGPNNWMIVLNHKEGPAFERIPIAAFGPVGHRLAYVGNKGGKSYVVVDGAISPAYSQVLFTEMQFSPDGQHIGYLAQTEGPGGGDTWHAVIDGKEQPGYKQVERLTFSKQGGHFAYVARTANAQEFSVVVDGQAGPKYQLIQSITFNDDGTHVAYVACKMTDPKAASRSPEWVAVIDGQIGPVFAQVLDVALNSNGQHSAYAATENNATGRTVWYAVVDGKKSLDYGGCGSFMYSPNNQHLAYVAMNNGKSVVVFDGREGDAYDSIDQQSMQFTPDGKRFGYLASGGGGWRAVIDGKAGQTRQAIESRSLMFSPDGQHYRFRTRNSGEWFVIIDDAATPAPGHPVTTAMVSSADGKHIATVTAKDMESQSPSMHLSLDGKPTGPDCRTIDQLQLSADGAHYACIGVIPDGNSREATHVVHDGHAGPGFMRIDRCTLSADGQHVAYAAYTSEGKKQIVVDDFAGPTFDDVIVVTGDCPQAIQFRDDGSLDFLAVTDQKLSRIVMPADAIAALPKPVDAHAPGAPGYAQIYTFGEIKDDGAKPAVLAAAPDGTLFGATTAGGEFNKGVIFSIKPDGTGYKIIRPIEGGQGDGSYPNSMWVGPDGALYGSFMGEGPSGYGVVFRCAADGSAYSLLHPFTGNKDGGSPQIYAVDADGAIFGLSNRDRTPLHLFSMKADGSDFKIIYEAPPPNTGPPDAGLGPFVDGGDGFLYGVAGMHIFKVKKNGTGYAIVRKFAGPPRDIQWADRAPILGADGMLYAFASSAGKTTGGVIYKINRDGSGYSMFFDPSDDMLGPRAMDEGPDGKLYLLANKGLVRVNKDGSDFTVLQEMNGGFFPLTALVHDGTFYGMTAQGNKGGFIFRYGIGGDNGSSGSPESPPSVVFQPIAPTPIDSNVEVPPTSGE